HEAPRRDANGERLPELPGEADRNAVNVHLKWAAAFRPRPGAAVGRRVRGAGEAMVANQTLLRPLVTCSPPPWRGPAARRASGVADGRACASGPTRAYGWRLLRRRWRSSWPC